LLVLAFGFLSWWLAKRQSDRTPAAAIIPAPATVELAQGAFLLSASTRIVVDAASRPAGEFLAARLRVATGFPVPVTEGQATSVQGAEESSARAAIDLALQSGRAELGAEGYQLVVTPESVQIRAAQPAGVFYGMQSLLQLLPPEVFSRVPVTRPQWRIPCVRIEDRPRFAWRGFMLDVSRHFFNKEEVKTLLEAMALHKLNVFHWHLTDDQGWRLEIKKHPRLTSVGAWRGSIGYNLDPKASTAYGPDGRYGGFYTQEEVREVVAFAQARQITVVPEIEMPGHATAALAAHPELSCTGGPYGTDVVKNQFDGVFCAGKEETFQFLEDVLQEVTELFPGPYLHVGGDEVALRNWRECPRCQSRIKEQGLSAVNDLQGYFIKRVQQIVQARDRKLVGWSEIARGGLPPGAVLMDWIGGGVEAAQAGHGVVMCPNTYCYFDFYQSQNRTIEPPAVGGYLPLQQVYSFEPIPERLAPQDGARILGSQGNVWTEYIASLRQVEYMTFPRLCALAEVVWSPATVRSWDSFRSRLRVHSRRLDLQGVHYRP
jgi:hexosaminidase